MASFLVERFWPGMTRHAAKVATEALLASGLAVLETIVASPDEVCLWYVEAVNAETVATAFAAAAVPVDRLTVATRIAARESRPPRPAR
jgi:hypothetical protein